MSKHTKILLSLLTLCAVAIGVGWRSVNSSVTTANRNSGAPMIDKIEEKARKAKGNDEALIRDLADEVFKEFAVDIPTDITAAMKDRLVSAEVKYRKTGKGPREGNVVRTINELANRFNAPDYAKATPLQVRTLRVELMKVYPSFIAQETDERKKGLRKKVGDLINPELSPLEATYLTVMMLHQKMLNDDFQQTPEDFPAKLRKTRLQGFNNAERQIGTGGDYERKRRNDEKRREMRAVFDRGVANLSMIDAEKMVSAALDNLGIER